jgi:hypothetical protein
MMLIASFIGRHDLRSFVTRISQDSITIDASALSVKDQSAILLEMERSTGFLGLRQIEVFQYGQFRTIVPEPPVR